ncbi:MAG: hypothetical protein AB7O73_06080 [Bacteroidia bacterium]
MNDLSNGLNQRKTYLSQLVIILSVYFTVFVSSFTFFKQPFEFHIGYLAYFTLVPLFYRKYGQVRPLLVIFSILLLVGVFNVYLGNNTFAQFFKVFIGLCLAYYLYYYFIKEFNWNIKRLFQWYLKGAYIASLIGAVQFVSYLLNIKFGYDYSWILNKWGVIPGGFFGIRINSIFPEPTYFATVLSTSFFVATFSLLTRNTQYYNIYQSILIVIVYFLSFSGIAQTAIFLAALFLMINFGLVRYIFVFIPVMIFMFNYLYSNVEEFKERYDSTIDLFSGGKFVLGKTHGSSFILYNNYVVATENFKKNPLFGTGIGSHVTAFEKYSIAKQIKHWGFNLNSADANSMFLRLMSETGLFGLGIFLVIIVKCYIKRNEDFESSHWIISNGILIMILLNLFRQGHYFLNGFPFFVLLYIYNYFDYQKLFESKENSDKVDSLPQTETNY